MKAKYFATLEAAIQEWADKNCDVMGIEDYSAYWYPDMVTDMAKAAAAIYDAVSKGQTYKDEQGD